MTLEIQLTLVISVFQQIPAFGVSSMPDDRKWIKPVEAAEEVGVSKATMYRLLPRIAADGVEIIKPSERVTLIARESFRAWIDRQRLTGRPKGSDSE
jgi:hypothetical protein